MIVVVCRPEDRLALARAGGPALQVAQADDYLGKVVKKPWGSEVEIHRGEGVSVTLLNIDAGGETSLHCHTTKFATITVSEGVCELETLRGRFPLKAGQLVRVEPGAFHRLRSEGGAVVVEMETPPNKTDLVRLEDRYGRQGKGYEAVPA